MRIGLNTGLVLLGEVGTTAEFTAIGDTVNTASRLEHAAPVGSILISHDTYRHVRGLFDVEPQAPLRVKGKSEPLQTYIVKRVKPRAFRLGTRGVEGLETKTIGRGRELDQLQTAYQTATSQPQTTFVTLVGEAGVGKSRLLYEFEKWLELQPELIRAFKGRASQPTQGIPHYLLRDVLATRFQILDSDPLAVVQQKFVTGLSEFLTQDSEMKSHILGTWLGYDFSHSPHLRPLQDNSEQINNRATLYLAQFLTAIAEKQPIVIFLEDVHWADAGSLDTLIDLARRHQRLPLLIIGLARPSLYQRRPDWGEKLPIYMRLDLSPLSGEDSRALIAEILRLVDPLPEIISDLISGRAEGNPFYAEELVKMLIDDGVIVTGPEKWHILAEKLLDLKVPPTLTGVLQARLDRLGTAEKQAIQQAAVIGRIFWDEGLAALSTGGQQSLSALHAKELIFQRPGSAFVGTTEYIFKHALLRDVTYETVLKRLRRQYHALVADWLVRAAAANGRSDEYAALIGEHYQLAAKPEQAAIWYGRTGEQAAATFAHEEAAHYLTLALQFTPSDDEFTHFALLKTREQVYHLQGDRHAQQQDLVQLANLASRLGVNERVIVALRQARWGEATGHYDQALSHAQAAIAWGQQGGDMRLVAEGYMWCGEVFWRRGQYPSAKEHYQTGWRLAQAIGALKQVAACLSGLGNVAAEQSEFAVAKEYLEQGLLIYRQINDRQEEGENLNNLGVTAENYGDYASAREYLTQALAVSREIGHRSSEGLNLTNLGIVAMNQGDRAMATAYYEQALVIVREIGNLYVEAAILHDLGMLALAEANLPLAESYFQQSATMRQESNQPQFLVEDWAGLGQVKLAQGDRAAAWQYGQQMLGYLQENPRFDGAINRMRPFRFLWELLIALNQTTRAAEVLALAAQVIQDNLDMNPDAVWQAMYLNQPHHRVLWQAWQ
jgi:tetratricopeptide (TPR) repeat protein